MKRLKTLGVYVSMLNDILIYLDSNHLSTNFYFFLMSLFVFSTVCFCCCSLLKVLEVTPSPLPPFISLPKTHIFDCIVLECTKKPSSVMPNENLLPVSGVVLLPPMFRWVPPCYILIYKCMYFFFTCSYL